MSEREYTVMVVEYKGERIERSRPVATFFSRADADREARKFANSFVRAR